MASNADRMPDLSGRSPDLTRKDTTVNYASTGDKWTGLEEDEKFAALWTGAVKIIAEGDYTFYINSDDGSLFTINGIKLIDNDYPHGMVEKSGTIALTPGKHSILLEFWERSGGAGMIFSYSGPDTGNVKEVVPSSALSEDGPTTTTTTPPGLLAEFFYSVGITSSSERMPDLSGQTPDVTRIDPGVNYGSTGSNWAGLTAGDYFAARWTGGIEITTGGEYEFYIESDDGSLFKIDGVNLIDNDYPHGMATEDGEIDLAPGIHNIEILMWERSGGAGMIFSYEGPDTGGNKQVVPGSVLVPVGPTTTTTTAGGLKAEFFYNTGAVCWTDLTSLTPDVTRKDSTVNYGSVSWAWNGLTVTDQFSARWT
eukprot:1202962-Amphidinium_carterae.1